MTRDVPLGNGVTRPQKPTLFVGAFVHSIGLTELEICRNGIIGVNERGRIAFIERDVQDLTATLTKNGWTGDESDYDVIRIDPKRNSFFFPGFIDTHIHASQYPNAGIFGKSTLLDWLNTYTFPLESSFSDLKKARRIYNTLVSRTLSHGTTTAAYYATIHVEATNLLADVCSSRGQRAFVGRVCMDSPEMSPDYYRDESTEEVLRKTRECIAHCEKINASSSSSSHATETETNLITPIITPRFAPSCTRQCLSELGDLQKVTGYPVQTHISENKKEIALVKQLFPESESYTSVYDDAGLLCDKTILAHAIHLNQNERSLIKQRKSKISHCPASNTAITSGRCPIRDLLDEGIDIGLGTDVSGGHSVSILESVRQAIWVSRHIAMGGDDSKKLSVEEALYLSTRGGAKVVGLENRIGGFEVGFDWDVQLIDLGQDVSDEGDGEGGPVDIFGWESWEDRVHKWVFGGDDRNTVAVWVKGRLVHDRRKGRP